MSVLIFSCDKSVSFVPCSDCTKEEPNTAVIEIKISETGMTNFTGIVVKIYAGDLEDKVLLDSLYTLSTHPTYNATLNKKYTITATYRTDGALYIAVGSVFPRVRYEPNQCTDPCYYIYDRKVNLKLKYM